MSLTTDKLLEHLFKSQQANAAFILRKLERIEETMATQAEVDTISTELQDAFDGIHAGFDELNAEIAALQAAQGNGESIDLTALKAKADALKGLVPTSAPSFPASTEPTQPDQKAPGTVTSTVPDNSGTVNQENGFPQPVDTSLPANDPSVTPEQA